VLRTKTSGFRSLDASIVANTGGWLAVADARASPYRRRLAVRSTPLAAEHRLQPERVSDAKRGCFV
jgi:hypothetical protein